jgi:hypothetical protein
LTQSAITAKAKKLRYTPKRCSQRMSNRRKLRKLREAPFHRVPQPIVILTCDHRSAALRSPVRWTSLGRDAHADASAPESAAQYVAIVAAIRHELVRSAPGASARARNADGVQGLFSQFDLCGVGAVEVKAQGQAVAFDH